MRKLLSSSLFRLWKSKAFWVLEAGVTAWGIFCSVLVILNTYRLGEAWLVDSANTYFYVQLLYLAAVLAIFSVLFIGTEYEHGTIRNKLSVGHSRKSIYLSNLIVAAFVGGIFAVSHVLTAFVAVPFVGMKAITGVSLQGWRFLCWGLIILVYSALFTLLAMLDSNKARNVLVSLLLALLLMFGGAFVHGKLAEPESADLWLENEQGYLVLQENARNSDHLTGAVRVVFDWLDVILPSSQGIRITNREGLFDVRMPVCSVVLTGSLTALGIALFKKKNVK